MGSKRDFIADGVHGRPGNECARVFTAKGGGAFRYHRAPDIREDVRVGDAEIRRYGSVVSFAIVLDQGFVLGRAFSDRFYGYGRPTNSGTLVYPGEHILFH
ncbi:MAG: hypothetical protein ACKO26_03000, partial [Planctomycetota bacterium]